MAATTTFTTVTITPTPARPDHLPEWLKDGRQGPRIEYNPTSEYKLKKGEKTGWGVIVQFTSRSQKEMNAIYVGGLEERRAEGYGEWHSEDEKLSYHGGWKENVACGWGRYTDSWTENWPDGWVRFLAADATSEMFVQYEGGWKDGYFHGYGELTFRDTSKYEGTWKNGRRFGYGKYTRRSGEIIEWQIEGAIKVESKKDKKKEKKDEKTENTQPAQPQVVIVQPPAAPVAPQYPQTVYVGPDGKPILQAGAGSSHEAFAQGQANVQFTLGHASQHQAGVQLQQPQGYYYQPVQPGQPVLGTAVELPPRITTPTPQYAQQHAATQPIEMPARPITPIPAQYAPRPVTPQPPGRHPSQGFIWAPPQPQIPPAPGSPGNPPYPPDVSDLNISGTQQMQGSPPNTQFFM